MRHLKIDVKSSRVKHNRSATATQSSYLSRLFTYDDRYGNRVANKWNVFSSIVKLFSLLYRFIALAASKSEMSFKCRLQFVRKLTSYLEAITRLNKFAMEITRVCFVN